MLLRVVFRSDALGHVLVDRGRQNDRAPFSSSDMRTERGKLGRRTGCPLQSGSSPSGSPERLLSRAGLAVLEDRARGGVVSPAAAAATEPLQPVLFMPVPPFALQDGQAGSAPAMRAASGEGPEPDDFPAFPLMCGRRQQSEIAEIQSGNHLRRHSPSAWRHRTMYSGRQAHLFITRLFD